MTVYDLREEVINVALAELLERRGLLTVPETIRRIVTKAGRRQLPDITVADLLGIRIVIEGRFNTGKAARDSLLRDAKERVEQGISPVCLAVLYPQDLRSTDTMPHLRKALEKTTFEVRVISEGGDGNWSEATVNDIAELLRSSYELLVSEDVVLHAVTEIESAIDFASDLFAQSSGLKERFRKALGIPKEAGTEELGDSD